MTVKTSLSFTDRHHRFIAEKVAQGAFASLSGAVAAGVERMIEDERGRDIALGAMAGEIRRRLQTPADDFIDLDRDGMFDAIRRDLRENTPE
jgi:Arc/MetJ-type ribon-helix-helix transcriptional regulator